jgi:hypothetical protein
MATTTAHGREGGAAGIAGGHNIHWSLMAS